jgi:hypothetical protein
MTPANAVRFCEKGLEDEEQPFQAGGYFGV